MMLGSFKAALAAARAGLMPVSARLGRAPHWVWPLAVAALFLAAGVLVVDDYAVWGDAVFYQRHLAVATLDFALGQDDALPTTHDRFYGAAFELLPLLVERIAGLDDTRRIYLTRHLMTHLFFIVGGVFCYLLVYRMYHSRLLALFAMLLFLLHPRMYGNSFFNSKDIPFLSMFMITLYCVHWAFRTGTVGAFLVCGAAVGILVNLRIMGALLLPAVLALRACDLYYAGGGSERRRVISSGLAFALLALATYYASLPYLWADPVGRFGELLATLSRHPTEATELFQGRYILSTALPASYLPLWIAITTPPWALLLAGVGAVGIGWRALMGWRDVAGAGAALRNAGLRFELLLLGCAALPVIITVVMQPNMYDGWRQSYYLWAPLCLLAAVGLQRGRGVGDALMRRCGSGRNTRRARVGLAGLAVVALAALIIPLMGLHPYQHAYFNWLVDRNTPEYLQTQWEMDYFPAARLAGYQYILDTYPDAVIHLETGDDWQGVIRYTETFPAATQRRLRADPATDADFYVFAAENRKVYAPGLPKVLLPPTLYARQVYHNTIMRVTTPDLSRVDADTAAAYRAIYRRTVTQAPTQRGRFDLYLNESEHTLTLVNEDCRPGDLSRGYALRVYPVNESDRPELYRRRGHINATLYGVRFDGKCLLRATLPDYPLARIVVAGVGEIRSDAYRAELRRQYATLRATAPAIQSTFAVYAGADELRYLKDECTAADRAAPFFLHLLPAAASDLPVARREYGYDERDFTWSSLAQSDRAVVFDDKCLLTVPLPAYTVAGIRTGQYLPGGGLLWSAAANAEAYRAAPLSRYADRSADRSADRYADLTVGAPAASGFFRIWHGGGALTYRRDDCAPADTDAPFYLHLFPAAVNGRPAEQREHGFVNRDFDFGNAGGVRYNGACIVSIPLPDYALARIHTGQYTPADGRRLWAAEIPVALRNGE